MERKENGKAIALWPHTARADAELTISVGSVITILEEDSTGWWKGELNGKVGSPNLNPTYKYLNYIR